MHVIISHSHNDQFSVHFCEVANLKTSMKVDELLQQVVAQTSRYVLVVHHSL